MKLSRVRCELSRDKMLIFAAFTMCELSTSISTVITGFRDRITAGGGTAKERSAIRPRSWWKGARKGTRRPARRFASNFGDRSEPATMSKKKREIGSDGKSVGKHLGCDGVIPRQTSKVGQPSNFIHANWITTDRTTECLCRNYELEGSV